MAAAIGRQPEGTYTFASQPKAVKQRNKFRDPLSQTDEAPPQYGNIMYDRRIVRGNTYAQHTLPTHAQPDPIEIQRQQENRRRAIARKRAKDQLRPRSPDPVDGRKHIDVQTELYLEELSDRVEEADVECQTDAFLDRPPSPLFIAAKTGVDVDTQIWEGDLFDFNVEVQPVLEVLVGKTVEQSLLEVMEEEELANLRTQQRAYEELRNAEVVEQQRLEEQERRHRQEKERRMKQQRDVVAQERETAEKIAARAFAHSYLSDLVPSVFGTLADNGYFYDPVERDVEQGFLPWLMDCVSVQLAKSQLGRTLLDTILREVVNHRNAAFKLLENPDGEDSPVKPATPVRSKPVSQPAVIPQKPVTPEQAAPEPPTEEVTEATPEQAADEAAPTQDPVEEGGGGGGEEQAPDDTNPPEDPGNE